MKKNLFFAAIAALSWAGASAQTVYNWNIRAGLGATSYAGATWGNQRHPASYQGMLERRINRGLGAFVSAEGGAIQSNLPATDPNFRTNFNTFTAGITLNPNNDRIMRYNARVVPTLGVGFGASRFNGVETFSQYIGWTPTASAMGRVQVQLTPNWGIYTGMTYQLPMKKSDASVTTLNGIFNGIFGLSYTFGPSSRENFTPNVFSYVETNEVIPPKSVFVEDPWKDEPKVDSTKMMNDELNALKQKVSAMEGDMSSLRSKAESGSQDAAELKRLQDEVSRLNGELEKAKNQIADLNIRDAAQAAAPAENPRNVGARDVFPGVNKQNYPNYFAYPPASLDGIFSQLKTVTLDMSGESTVRGENRNQLVNIPDLLARYPNLGVVISANASGAGGSNADLALSKKRAVSAEQFFLRNGATSRQVISNYYGSEDPNAGNTMTIEFIKVK